MLLMENLLLNPTKIITDVGPKNVFYIIFFVSSVVALLWIPNSEWVSNFAPNLDWPILIFGIGVFSLALLGNELFNGSAAVALVTAFTAFVAIYRLRRPDETERPAIRLSFEDIEDEEYMDFGLRNYGPGAALYLQIEATTDSGQTIFKFEPRDYPVHLEEGDFLGLIYDNRWSCTSLLDLPNIEGDGMPKNEKVYIYYSYVSTTGARTPEAYNNVQERPDKPILEKLKRESEKPRQMELRRIWRRCSPRVVQNQSE